ncbi:MAG TPA: acyl-CoA dehydrogenase family protein [Pseudogracilibacillus sp.]|nr:acyl-CoA dehydrogenase family protein [Pseudogracilibacillus sp.]
MLTKPLIDQELLGEIIDEHLRPFVKRIDEEAFYAKTFLEKLGEAGFFAVEAREQDELEKRFIVIEETAKVCMTTAFCIWCHLAATTYLTHTENESLKNAVLPKLLTGKLLAGTGLSNPLKSFAKLETLHLKAEKVRGGYIVRGALPAVSNIGPGQAFAFIAEVESDEKVMGFVYCDDPAITLRARTGYIGLNGSATFSCAFQDIFIPDAQIIATNVDTFVEQVRTRFLAYQIPLALGVTAASVNTMDKIANKYHENNINQYLRVQPEDLNVRNDAIRSQLADVIGAPNLSWDTLTDIRLEATYVTLDAVQAAMLHHGGRGYVKSSVAERKLREAYFLVNLTPTIKHLETLKRRT